MSQPRAATRAITPRYKRADKTAKGVIFDEPYATTGWHATMPAALVAMSAVTIARRLAGDRAKERLSHEGGNTVRDHCHTLTIAGIATGWNEDRSVPNKPRSWVVEGTEETAMDHATPGHRGDSDDGSEFINYQRPFESVDGCIVNTLGAIGDVSRRLSPGRQQSVRTTHFAWRRLRATQSTKAGGDCHAQK